MNLKQKNQLKNQLKSQISNKKLSIEDIKKIASKKRKSFINDRLVKVDALALDWALNKQVISVKELTTDSYFINNHKLSELITSSGLLVAGGVGSATAFTATLGTATIAGTGLAGTLGGGFFATAAANVGLGTVATTAATITATTVVATVAPAAIAIAGIYGFINYKKNKEIESLKEDFENGKVKILNFYLSKINTMKDIVVVEPAKVIVKEKKNKPTIKKDKQIQNSNNQKASPSSKKPDKKVIKPTIKQIARDPDYDKCVVRYDESKSCTIKHEGNIRGKKNGLHGETFKSFVHKIPPIIGHDIFNSSKTEITFIGTKHHFKELKNACKTFEENDRISIKISFRDIAKKV